MAASAKVDGSEDSRVLITLAVGRYLAIPALAIALLVLFALIGYTRFAPLPFGYNPFAQITSNGDTNWYRDFGGRYVPEIQDEELFYHNVGGSVAAARQADIVILGPSFSSYAFDRDTLRTFEQEHNLKIYNMSFIGIRGGLFSLNVIERWNIRPKLWVINVDDQAIHFFSRTLDLTLGPKMQTIPATQHGRLRGFVNVIGQNFRWRLEDWLAGYESSGIARNISNGDVFLDSNPRYLAADNKDIPFELNRDCHASRQMIEIAKDYVRRIGGQVVFTLVPHSQACKQQALELANALGVELIVPTFVAYSSVDGGGHLDKKGAVKFSNFFFMSLLQSEAFKKIKNQDSVVGVNKLLR